VNFAANVFRVYLTVGARSAKFEIMNHRGCPKFERWRFWAGLVAALGCCFAVSAPTTARQLLQGHVPAVVSRLVPDGRLPAATNLSLTIGLPLRDEAALNELLRQLYDPGSTNFHKFLTPPEFTARFGPTEQNYQAVIKFADANRLTVAGTHPNRVVLDVEGSASNIEQAFQITLRTYRHPTEARDFFAPDAEPSVPANLSVVTVEGLSDYGLPRPLLHKMDALKFQPLGGSGPGGNYAGSDFRNAYVPGTTLNGAGQSVGLLEFSAYFPADITKYENTIGLASYVPLKNVIIGSRAPSTANNDEVALDIEVAIAMAPGLSQVIVYETRSGASSILSRMANDNLAKQMSSSWTWGGGPSATIDNIFKQMAAQGQSYFQASGDSDAYTGSQLLDAASQVNSPVGSINITAVGGTTLTMNGSGTSWASETVWNWSSKGGSDANVGSSGGVSTYYQIPWWQTNIDMTANLGSTTMRNVPDVALTADNVFVDYNNGSSGGFGGTSCAAPLWAGFTALVNQQSVAFNGTTVGFLNPALYAVGAGTNYTACFNDITTGNNIGSGTPGLYYAAAGYDLCTGLGTPNGTNLINALAPRNVPYFITQPFSQTVTNANSITFSATVGGPPPFSYFWRFNGTNLPASGNISGATSNILTIAAVTISNAGNYTLLATNIYGSATSSVATLTVLLPPVITASLTNQTVQCGGNVAFSVTATGTPPLNHQWSLDGGAIAGATNASLSLINVHGPDHFVAVLVTNIYGSATNSVTLTVVDTLAPAITLNGGNPAYVELGGTFTDPGATASDACAGMVPVAVAGAVNSGAVGTYTLTYTADDGNGNTNTVARAVIVRDTTPPTVLWSFTNLVVAANTNCSATMPDVTGTNFILATDLSEPLAISQYPTNGAVLPLGTNMVVIAVSDFYNNTSYSTNTVIVQDQIPPAFFVQPQSQTNLVGTTAAFSAAAEACTPTAYQWFFNSAILAVQTNNTLTIASVSPASAGNYSVIATASGGSTTSAVATLTVNLNPTSLGLNSSENPAGFGDVLNFTAVAAPAGAGGTVQFFTNGFAFDTETLAAGQAVSTNLSILPRGTNVIAAIYSGDANDLPATNSLSQIVTNHSPVAADVFYDRLAGYALDIAVADLTTNWSDPDGDPVSLAGISVSTDGVTVTNNAGTLVYFDTNNVDDQFVCAISDGWGGTNFQTVYIDIVLTNTIPSIIGVGNGSNGNVTLTLGGAPGDTYVLEAAADLVSPANWQPLATNTLGTNGLWQFTDPQVINFTQRFYRLKLAQ
jgi:hypothetical protein